MEKFISTNNLNSSNSFNDNKLLQLQAFMLLGIQAGMAHSLINYPPASLAIMQQRGDKINFHPKELYRGIVAYSMSRVPSTCLQVTVSCLIKADNKSISESQKFLAAASAGMISAVFNTSLENVILQQKALKVGPTKALSHIIKNKGATSIMKGYSSVSIRDSIFASSSLWAKDCIKENYMANCGIYGDVLSSIIIGFFASIASHPFDVVGRKIQHSPVKLNAMTAAREIYSQRGIGGFSPGFFYRTCSMIGGIGVISHIVKRGEENFGSFEI